MRFSSTVAGIIVVLAGTAGVVALAWPARHPVPQGDLAQAPSTTTNTTTTTTTTAGSGAQPAAPHAQATAPASASTAARPGGRPALPARTAAVQALLTRVEAMDPGARTAFVTERQTDPHLDAVTVQVLVLLVENPELSALVRNNAANALAIQQPPDPDLAARFAAMIDDPANTYEWREYALQHLANTLAFSRDPAAGVETLMQAMRRGQESMPSTAMLQLSRLGRDKTVVLDQRFTSSVMAMAEDPATSVLNRISALGLLGERRITAGLSVLRQGANAAQPSVRRTAIASLGLIGEAADRELIATACADADPSIAASANAALATLDRRLAALP